MKALLAALSLCAAAAAAGQGPAPLGLPPLPSQPKPLQAALGQQLFFDRRLSSNGSMSCAMCHVPEQAFASNASALAVGIEGKSLRRNAPTLLNVAWQPLLFHDGRTTTLQAQAWLPLVHADEMGNPSVGHVLARIRALPEYRGRFERAFAGQGPTRWTVGAALAAYEQTLVSANSRFDRWRYGGQADTLNAIEQQGYAVFAGKGRCTACHRVDERHALLADGRFHATGAGAAAAGSVVVTLAPGLSTQLGKAELAAFAAPAQPDLGRYEVTHHPADRHAFRTPTLRNVARTAPYMHDGSLASLADVIEFYDRGGGVVPNKSPLLQALGLSAAEKQALLAFLLALNGGDAPRVP
jgi:cytochrome c peroxidase